MMDEKHKSMLAHVALVKNQMVETAEYKELSQRIRELELENNLLREQLKVKQILHLYKLSLLKDIHVKHISKMYWKTRGYGNAQPLRRHLGDNGEECGCYSDDSMDGWGGYKHRTRIICDTHVRRRDRDLRRSWRHYAVQNKYNYDTNLRLKQIADYSHDLELDLFDDLTDELRALDDDLVPIKYLYEKNGWSRANISHINWNEREWFKVHKIGARYYCCKNRIAYHEQKYKDISAKVKREKELLISSNGWTDDDLTTRSYKWIKVNDKAWLKEYKRLLRIGSNDDDCNHLVRMLEKDAVIIE